ncbi:hypothetical protein [Thermomonospora umbrina]|uniref:Uncharacterized protein n=1 Tax=Thermomonospora umbrina TaxID=111806 RepID=A0A3D9T471_9ACTN|nr:hypothetical protein [Thermomonospora umbrina]REF00046.1 hypothetical protein DFJ69_5568 [Thermomonospora umbrina]
MNAHLTDSDREALWLAQELREELRQALGRRGVTSAPGVSPFVDSAGCPSVLVRMDADAARALSIILAEARAAAAAAPPAPAPQPAPVPPRHTGPQPQVFPSREPVGHPRY